MRYAEIICSSQDSEATSYPFWGIALRAGHHGMILLDGIWFNRADADRWFQSARHRYPKKAIVYCFSGNASWHIKELYAKARAETEAKEEASVA